MTYIRPLKLTINEMKTNILLSGLVKINGYEMQLTESNYGGLVQLFVNGYQEVFIKKTLIEAVEMAIKRTEELKK